MNLFVDEFLNIWNSEKYIEARRLFSEKSNDISKICYLCRECGIVIKRHYGK
ncbi:hypothetical protein THIOM_002369 [Candidatus Thiomargarita nelsonii]|uniref:Uncharacterized protein n=1 Tax=Candidatus Thiomargarita nelsonii TaxID=1003181 RepID=A0A176S1M8_9GAMM|nr:hypothetical protein THIOM_002369 [Candidatus Thiomargarita nelsonii]